jgi:glycosyltransferase involved in cell wall biosynthesis
VGRLAPVKNIFNLIEALSETGFTLDIYGDGQLREQLASKAKDLKIDLNFMGIVANDELPEILSRYHYFILPSLYEGMPKSLLEAMACGLVCIGTDVEGINEIIEDRINGFLANGTSTEALAKAIKTATQLPTETIIKEAVQKIRDNFSVPIITEKEKRILTALEK